MPTHLNSSDSNFNKNFDAFLKIRETSETDVSATVAAIIKDIRKRGDAALLETTQKFDSWKASAETIKVSAHEIADAVSLVTPEVMKSLKIAAARIQAYSEKQLPEDKNWTDEQGVKLGWKWTAVDAAGLYVPGGKAAYPSSVLMNAMLAKVAGVKRLVMVVPTPNGEMSPVILAAAHVAGIEEIYKIGGAQAVAALAYGTDTIAPVDIIVGPGNAYVAEAKRQVFGQVGIDMIAGPSEILVVADNKNSPEWIAADLLSQAEHDETAQSVLITNDAAYAKQVEAAVEATLKTLPREKIARTSWEKYGAVVVVKDWSEATSLINAMAPEHLELAVETPEALLPNIQHAGAVFLGRHTPEAIGDYLAGPSHVLPTSRTARFSSGLSVLNFMKRTSLIGCDAAALKNIGEYGEMLALEEGLQAHALSLSLRKEK